MLPSLEEISRRRRILGLTQKDLANLANVSQSLIAKLESGKIDSSYTKVKAIFDSLERIEIEKKSFVRDVLNPRIIGIQKDRNVSDAVQLMKENGYSQLPVFDGEFVIGSVSEKTILKQISDGKDLNTLSKLFVSEIMEEAFPQIAEDTPLSMVSNLLQGYSAILATKKGKIVGILTKADLLKILS
jgi:predicted transcriptional regulator